MRPPYLSFMPLIPVETAKIAVGEPVPWTVFDQDSNVLLECGDILENQAQLEGLLSLNPMRERQPGDSHAQSAEDDGEAAGGGLGAAGSNGAEGSFTFADMRLRVGDRIQLQPPAAISTERFIVRLIGYLDKVSLMVTMPIANSLAIPVREHDKIVARVFSSQKAFGFDCAVMRVCKLPYQYLHLSFPSVVQGAVVRTSPRIRTKIIASITHADIGDRSEKMPGVIVDLSADGAQVRSRQQLGDKSQEILLSFRISLHEVDTLLTTRAVIRNVIHDEEGTDPLRYHHGIQFLDLASSDRMILQSLIYQQMIEQPHTMA